MAHEFLSLAQAAEHIHLDARELRHAAQRGELEAQKRGDEWYFDHTQLDEWAQRNVLAVGHREQLRQHQVMLDEERRAKNEWLVHELFRPDGIVLGLPGKTKAGVIRDMSDLAMSTGLVYDGDGLFKELLAREEVASTAVGEGAAFLHPRYHDPYFFEDNFIVYGRAAKPVFFGSPTGEVTRHFFLICSTDHERHLHILSRLAVMAHATEFLQILDEATTPEQVVEIIRSAELGLIN